MSKRKLIVLVGAAGAYWPLVFLLAHRAGWAGF